MQRKDFDTGINLLIETYGDKSYPDPRVKRIWNWAKRLDGKTFLESVDNAVADCAHAPLLSKLKEFYSEVRAKYPDREKIKCDYCDGSGFILGEGVTPLAYACRCGAGDLVPVYITRWNGPWTRIVPRPNEIMRVRTEAVVGSTMKGIGDA